MADNPLVYSTESGRIKQEKPNTKPAKTASDGIVRILKQVSGRKGKGVSIITGLDLDDSELTKLASELKKLAGCGGSVKNGTIEIQGDKRELLSQILTKKGYKVKLAGG